ncbi:NRAMP family divalent metal transporter [Phreatobacter oligotrophus]|uniref:NRAMP (Natural resistance-associated macrophage protein)-like metal ion transporter n=1 Tax=Phreatobacter oligotrophus TaxID=1122261 RepID=A0A2T4ZG84_9HYPH|nr:divalent metal cation transporter [Phreatobacter oligotrophus]PTM60903.1 NRAMP (natural resistance-associated macrophage protein)-like metal ion transporter [Phreatobacter oligotrophus]
MVDDADDVRTTPHLLGRLGPGLVTGAADDDPSGIATYSQVGAQFGYALSWTMLFSFPLMAAIQAVAARIGCVTGRGIAANLRRHYPRPLLAVVVLLLAIANIFNLGADLGAMAAAVELLIGGQGLLYTVLFGIACALAEIFISYSRYARLLKWATLSLFAYVAVVLSVGVPWGEALKAIVVPQMSFDRSTMVALVAVLGTTISPYLFFWQAAQETEELRRRHVKALCLTPATAGPELARIRDDTLVGMGVSNLIALFIILATAATLHSAGVTQIDTAAQAAEALRPVAGPFAFALFAIGIIATGLLAVPVLAGSVAYAVSELFAWRTGLDRPPAEAKLFYGTIALATLAGIVVNVVGLDPIRALYWSAVLNGLLAAPVMAVTMVIAMNPRVMGRLTLPPLLIVGGWLATAVMAAASLGFLLL